MGGKSTQDTLIILGSVTSCQTHLNYK